MLECNNTVTIIHHDRASDDDLYICTAYDSASWFKKKTITTSADGAKPVNTYDVRIMTDEEIEVDLGDFVALGNVDAFETQSDLKDFDYFRITAVGDNRRGILAHWRVSGQ